MNACAPIGLGSASVHDVKLRLERSPARDKVLQDAQLLVQKSLIRNCEACSTRLGWWIWIDNQQLLCRSCVDAKVAKAPMQVKNALCGNLTVSELPTTTRHTTAMDSLANFANSFPPAVTLAMDGGARTRRSSLSSPPSMSEGCLNTPASTQVGLRATGRPRSATLPNKSSSPLGITYQREPRPSDSGFLPARRLVPGFSHRKGVDLARQVFDRITSSKHVPNPEKDHRRERVRSKHTPGSYMTSLEKRDWRATRGNGWPLNKKQEAKLSDEEDRRLENSFRKYGLLPPWSETVSVKKAGTSPPPSSSTSQFDTVIPAITSTASFDTAPHFCTPYLGGSDIIHYPEPGQIRKRLIDDHYRSEMTAFVGKLAHGKDVRRGTALKDSEPDATFWVDKPLLCTLCPSSVDHPRGTVVLDSQADEHWRVLHAPPLATGQSDSHSTGTTRKRPDRPEKKSTRRRILASAQSYLPSRKAARDRKEAEQIVGNANAMAVDDSDSSEGVLSDTTFSRSLGGGLVGGAGLVGLGISVDGTGDLGLPDDVAPVWEEVDMSVFH